MAYLAAGVAQLLSQSPPVATHHPLELGNIIIAMMWLLRQAEVHTTIL